MITIFTTTKAFKGHTGIIQRNAIKSWTLLMPRPQVILFGNEPGTAEATEELEVRHIPNIKVNKNGTPLVSSMANAARKIAEYDILVYVNADIILLKDFIPAVKEVSTFNRFLLVGRRRLLDVEKPIDFNDSFWEENIRQAAEKQGSLDTSYAIDFFVMNKELWRGLPPLAIGRAGWDNYMLFRARSKGMALIDATPVTMVIHQNHDYAHHSNGKDGIMKGSEAQKNIQLAKNVTFTVDDAIWKLTSNGPCSTLRGALYERHIAKTWYLIPHLGPLRRPIIGTLMRWPALFSWIIRLTPFLRK